MAPELVLLAVGFILFTAGMLGAAQEPSNAGDLGSMPQGWNKTSPAGTGVSWGAFVCRDACTRLGNDCNPDGAYRVATHDLGPRLVGQGSL